PVINIDDDGEAVKVSVSQCRGISPSGAIIEISPSNAINASFPKSQIEGYRELGVYIVCEPHDKFVEDGYDDPANPQIKSTRRHRYRLKLDVTGAEAAHSLMISLRRKAAQGRGRHALRTHPRLHPGLYDAHRSQRAEARMGATARPDNLAHRAVSAIAQGDRRIHRDRGRKLYSDWSG